MAEPRWRGFWPCCWAAGRCCWGWGAGRCWGWAAGRWPCWAGRWLPGCPGRPPGCCGRSPNRPPRCWPCCWRAAAVRAWAAARRSRSRRRFSAFCSGLLGRALALGLGGALLGLGRRTGRGLGRPLLGGLLLGRFLLGGLLLSGLLLRRLFLGSLLLRRLLLGGLGLRVLLGHHLAHGLLALGRNLLGGELLGLGLLLRLGGGGSPLLAAALAVGEVGVEVLHLVLGGVVVQHQAQLLLVEGGHALALPVHPLGQQVQNLLAGDPQIPGHLMHTVLSDHKIKSSSLRGIAGAFANHRQCREVGTRNLCSVSAHVG